MFGTRNPWDVVLVYHQNSALVPNARNLVALMHVPVTNEGDVFAFTARVFEAQPFYFQIWRPTGAVKEFKLIASERFTPSVSNRQHENVRLTVLGASFDLLFLVLHCDS